MGEGLERTKAKKYFILPSVDPGLVKMAMMMAHARNMTRPWMAWRTIFVFCRILSGSRILNAASVFVFLVGMYQERDVSTMVLR